MKKLLHKLRRTQPEPVADRITSDTIAEHREKILAGGRRFKYPLQYARHKLVFNAVIIGVATLALLALALWWQLYLVQNTSDFMYRVTKVIPLPVASVDGERVAYSDYLMKYRSSVHYLEEKEQVNFGTPDGQRQSNFVKRQAMDDAIADAYAEKIAKQKDITVSDVELETYLKLQRFSPDGEVSENTYNAVILDYYGWSPDEYRHAMKQKLLRQKVAYELDARALHTIEVVEQALRKNSKKFSSIIDKLNKQDDITPLSHGSAKSVPKTNQDGGLAAAAAQLKKGDVSAVVKSTSGGGYYFIKVTAITQQTVSYEYINIPLTEFTNLLDQIKAAGKISTRITLKQAE